MLNLICRICGELTHASCTSLYGTRENRLHRLVCRFTDPETHKSPIHCNDDDNEQLACYGKITADVSFSVKTTSVHLMTEKSIYRPTTHSKWRQRQRELHWAKYLGNETKCDKEVLMYYIILVCSAPVIHVDGFRRSPQSNICITKLSHNCYGYSSHRRRRQDKTVLSCLVGVSGVNYPLETNESCRTFLCWSMFESTSTAFITLCKMPTHPYRDSVTLR